MLCQQLETLRGEQGEFPPQGCGRGNFPAPPFASYGKFGHGSQSCRRVAKHRNGAPILHQNFVGPGIERVAAINPVRIEQPQVSGSADGPPCDLDRFRIFVGGIRVAAQAVDPYFYFVEIEAGRLNGKIECQRRQLLERLARATGRPRPSCRLGGCPRS